MMILDVTVPCSVVIRRSSKKLLPRIFLQKFEKSFTKPREKRRERLATEELVLLVSLHWIRERIAHVNNDVELTKSDDP